ncbi:hypothetical protein evm_012988 [Chilo suppressalis]|nr:hypothetical protein evm_012988 [Chilo suppressalis]
MGRRVLSLSITLTIVAQVFAINLHPMVKQYLQLAGLGTAHPQSVVKTLPVPVSKQAPNLQTLTALASLLGSNPATYNTRTTTPSNILASLSSDAYISKYPIPNNLPPITPSLDSIYTSSNNPQSTDESLVKSLVLALLILSNLLNTQSESALEATAPNYPLYDKSEPIKPVSVAYAHSPTQAPVAVTPLPSQSQPSYQSNMVASHQSAYYPSHYDPQQNHAMPISYESQSHSMPNSNFVGSSSFIDQNPLMSTVPLPSSPSRSGLSLMSPYEALSPNSPFSDPILSSPYGSVMTSKIQSPYSAILSSDTNTKDVLNFSDFF